MSPTPRPRHGLRQADRGTVTTLYGLAVYLLVGCASPLPVDLRHDRLRPLEIARVGTSPEQYRGQWVRWGGHVVQVENGPQSTRLEILSLPLEADGRPDPEAEAGPRFMVLVPGFLDPARYAPQRLVTLVGRIVGERIQPVGEYPYHYVELEARAVHLWPEPQPGPPASPRYDPWYGPWLNPWWRPLR